MYVGFMCPALWSLVSGFCIDGGYLRIIRMETLKIVVARRSSI
jgi:hypothetical protein